MLKPAAITILVATGLMLAPGLAPLTREQLTPVPTYDNPKAYIYG